MATIRSFKEAFKKENSKASFLIFLIVMAAAPPLSFVSMFAHEGGHGLLVLPAIILNREIPDMPTVEESATEEENREWNPFRNFPAGIFLMFLSFPMGVIANGILSYLSYKNSKRYISSAKKGAFILLAVSLSFCIMNFNSALSNFFAQDFAFIWKGIGFPYDAEWFRYFIKFVAYLGFPLFLITKKGFAVDKTLTVSAGTYAGSILVGTFIFMPLYGTLMANFWWMFIVGLPVFVVSAAVLWRLQKFGAVAGI